MKRLYVDLNTLTSAPNNKRLIGDASIQKIFEAMKNTGAAPPWPLCGKGRGLSQGAPSPTLGLQPRGAR